ncbi:MAG: nucleotide exchange factor GrpE [Candidatus Omnitrophica bacterium]|jgi:molecular chaperone GrpE|nr:nucleotide exchange factor GrpE [Candidatus Omnitrophota bacterium]
MTTEHSHAKHPHVKKTPHPDAENTAENGQSGTAEAETVTVAKAEWEALSGKAAEAEAKYLLAAADFENMKKRLQKRSDDLVKFAIENLVSDIIAVVDDLDRAIGSLDKGHDPKEVQKGLHLAQGTFHKILAQNGVEAIDCVNKPFDANLHEAVAEVVDEAREDESVVEEVQKGYTLHGRLVRPSKVKISKKA